MTMLNGDLPQTPWLSILLPVHKVEAYLPACAQSILAQADEGVELVFVDDASPDASASLVQALQLAHPGQVRLIRHPLNLGISAARNTLLDAARGEYVWFIDPDDLMEPGALARLRQVIEADDPDLVLCDFRSFDDEEGAQHQRARYAHIASFSRQLPPATPSGDSDLLLQGLFMQGQWHAWSKIVRRSAWPATLRFPQGRTFEDLALFPRLVLHTRRFVHVSEVWVAYRQRAGSALSSLSAARLDEWMSALVGYGDEVRHCKADTQFEIAHYCARTLLRAIRRSRKLGVARPAGMLQRFAEQFTASSPLSAEDLLKAYLRRGRLLRWAQLRHQWSRLR